MWFVTQPLVLLCRCEKDHWDLTSQPRSIRPNYWSPPLWVPQLMKKNQISSIRQPNATNINLCDLWAMTHVSDSDDTTCRVFWAKTSCSSLIWWHLMLTSKQSMLLRILYIFLMMGVLVKVKWNKLTAFKGRERFQKQMLLPAGRILVLSVLSSYMFS